MTIATGTMSIMSIFSFLSLSSRAGLHILLERDYSRMRKLQITSYGDEQCSRTIDIHMIIKILSSTYTALLLIGLIVILSAYGTLLAPSPAKGFASLYGSPVFFILFFLLAVNIIMCSIRRLPRVIKQLRSPPVATSPEFFTRQAFHHITSPSLQNSDKVIVYLEKNFNARSKKDDLYCYTYQKGILNRLGSYVLHLGILVILAAGLIRFFLLQAGYVVQNARAFIPEGDFTEHYYVPRETEETGEGVYEPQALGFRMRCLDFDAVTYPGSRIPKYYSSIVQVFSGEQGNIYKIDMNNPLVVQGFKFHQVDYKENFKVHRYEAEITHKSGSKTLVDFSRGVEVPFSLNGDDQNMYLLEITREEGGLHWTIIPCSGNYNEGTEEYTGVVAIEGSPYAFEIARFVRDFRIGEEGRVFSETDEFNNPAVHIVTYKNGTPMQEQWCFYREEFRGFGSKEDDLFEYRFHEYSLPRNDAEAITFTIGVFDATTGEQIGKFGIGVRQVQRITSSTSSIPEPETESNAMNTDDFSGGAFSVRLRGTTKGYTTFLGVVREPTLKGTMLGGVVVVIGAFFIFFISYRRYFALYDSTNRTLYLAMQSRNPTWGVRQEWKHLCRHFSRLEE